MTRVCLIRPTGPPPEGFRARATLIAACCVALALSGCGTEELATEYGRQRVTLEQASVNGTDVLAAMFAARGHQVASRRTLITAGFESVDTIVWFPDDFAAPREEVCNWFDVWLSGGPGRTLIYVGRDFDAARRYWQKMLSVVSPEKRAQYQSRLRGARFSNGAGGSRKPDERKCAWFTLQRESVREIRELTGPWAAGIDPAQADIEVQTKWQFTDPPQELLRSKDDTIVASLQNPTWLGGKLITVTNGSFLLNLPLVNREHRKLAGKLIDAAGAGPHVVFLESGPGGPPVDPTPDASPLVSLFGSWPLNVILLQLTVLGIMFCFARWPIFGRPRQLLPDALSDFGRHIEAVGQLLRRTRDRDYALTKVAEVEPAAPAKTRRSNKITARDDRTSPAP